MELETELRQALTQVVMTCYTLLVPASADELTAKKNVVALLLEQVDEMVKSDATGEVRDVALSSVYELVEERLAQVRGLIKDEKDPAKLKEYGIFEQNLERIPAILGVKPWK